MLVVLSLAACAGRARPAAGPEEGAIGPLPPAVAAPPASTSAADPPPDACAPLRLEVERGETSDNRVALGKCEEEEGHLVNALREYQKALVIVLKAKQIGNARAVQEDLKRTLGRIPHLAFEVPPAVSSVEVWFDDRPVPSQELEKRFTIDPGDHRVRATGVREGRLVHYEETIRVAEAANLKVPLQLD